MQSIGKVFMDIDMCAPHKSIPVLPVPLCREKCSVVLAINKGAFYYGSLVVQAHNERHCSPPL